MSFGRIFEEAEKAFEVAEQNAEQIFQAVENDFSNFNMGNEHHNRHEHHNQHQQNNMGFGGEHHRGNHHGNQGNNFFAQEIFAEQEIIAEENAELRALRLQREREEDQLRLAQIENNRIAKIVREQALAREVEAQRRQDIEYEKEQARLAIEQQAAAERAEKRRIAERKHQAELQAEREKLAAELQAQREKLDAEKEDKNERFKNTSQKNIPLDNDTTLFYQIIINTKLASEQKYLLLDIMLTKLGYLRRIDLLFSSPIIEMLLNDATPSKLLEPLYHRAVFTLGMTIIPELEPQIWFKLIISDPLFANKMLDSLFASTLGHQKIMQFIDYWRSIQIFAVAGAFEAFYVSLLTRHKAQLHKDLLALIEANFLAITQNNWADFIHICMTATVTTEMMLQTFQRWSLTLVPEDIGNTARFVNSLEAFLSNRILDPNLHIAANLLHKLYPIDEHACDHICKHLNLLRASPQLLLPLLVNWLAAYQLPHDFTAVRQHYFELMLMHDIKTQLNQEEKIWEGLIKSNVVNGQWIFDALIERHATADKLMEFTKCWIKALTNQHDINIADAHIEARIKQASLQHLASDFKLITEIYTLRRVAESKVDDDENTVANSKALLENSRVSMASRIFHHADKKHAPYDIYHQLRHKQEHAKAHLAEEETIAAQHINTDLEKEGVTARFSFS